jgi:hypothetical protein
MDAAEARDEVVARLERSRAELRALLEPAEPGTAAGRATASGRFPRSHTMRLLTSKRGAGTAAAVGVGLLLSRPAMALRLAKMIPLGAVVRMMILRLFTASGANT